MYYSKSKVNDVANGPGLRISLFTSGCTHHCKGCFQPETWCFTSGKPYTEEVQNSIIEKSHGKYIAGLSLLGGDPFDNVDGVLGLLKEYRDTFGDTKTVWLWTGYLIEEVMNSEQMSKVLPFVDVIVDGEFIEEQKDITLKYMGSSNQRVIDVPKTLEAGEIILLDY